MITIEQKKLIKEMTLAGLLIQANNIIIKENDKQIDDNMLIYENKYGKSILDLQENEREKEREKHIGPVKTPDYILELDKQNSILYDTIKKCFTSLTGYDGRKTGLELFWMLEKGGLICDVK